MAGDGGRLEQHLAVFADVPGRYGIEVIAAEVGAADGGDLGKELLSGAGRGMSGGVEVVMCPHLNKCSKNRVCLPLEGK
jgi:hypothetical protein